jgi:hypothetical protein
MTTKNFNAKKVLMSAIAAVVFSFVFTTSANAGTQKEVKNDSTEIRQPSNDNGQDDMQDLPDIFLYILQTIFGVRV